MRSVMWFIDAAFADTDVSCENIHVASTIPAADTTAFPEDGRLVALFAGDCPPGAGDWLFDAINPADGAVLATRTVTAETVGASRLVALEPDATWPANTALTLKVTGPAQGVMEIPFTTGAGAVRGIEGVATATLTGVTVENAIAIATLDLSPAVDLDDLTLVRVAEPGGQFSFVQTPGPAVATISWSQADQPVSLCVAVTQIDALGREAETINSCVDAVYIDPPKPRGCATVGAGPWWLLALVAGAVRRRGAR